MSRKSSALRFSLPQILLLGFFLLGCAVVCANDSDPWLRPAAAPAPADNVPNAARIKLGQMLFFDPRLSKKASMSCATCHNPSLGWSDGLTTAVGFDMQILGRNTPTMTRFRRQDTRNCVSCHRSSGGPESAAGPASALTRVPGMTPMYEGLEGRYNPPDATWATFDRLKKLTSMKVMLKGIDSAEDAQLAVEHGVDGIVVSNQGGRATETLRGTIDCLPEVVQAVPGFEFHVLDADPRRIKKVRISRSKAALKRIKREEAEQKDALPDDDG